MEQNSLVVVEQPQNVQISSVLIIEQFLTDNYLFRRNVLNGKVEFAVKAVPSADFRPLTQEGRFATTLRTDQHRYHFIAVHRVQL